MTMARMKMPALGLALALVPLSVAQFIGGGFTNPHCDFASFQARAAEVTQACCEGKGDEVCPATSDGMPGTPVACDLECALKYVRFFDECEQLIQLTGSPPSEMVLVVGSSRDNTKAIGAAGVTSCDATPVNDQNPSWRDTFSVEISDGGGEVRVTRIDSASGWGQELELRCVASQMEALQQLMNMCEHLDTRVVLDLVDDLLGTCPLVQMDCTGVDGCRGGPPLQCAAADGAGEQQLAEVITVGEEIAYTGLCLGSVDGGGWTFVNEEGRSTTDLSDVTQEMAGGYHQFVYDTKGMVFNQVLVHRTSPTWCDSWGHTGSFWGVPGLTTASMGIAMGHQDLCYHHGGSGFPWLTMPYCTRSIGGSIPPTSCVGPAGVPYVGHVWNRNDPNNVDDMAACTTLTIQNVCADGESLCGTVDECTACGADGSWTVVSTADPLNKQEYLEIENLDAWLEDMGGCDGASTPSGRITVGDINNGVACDDNAVGTGYLMYSEQRTFDRFEVPPLDGNADHIIAVTWHPRGPNDHPTTCPLGQVRYGDGSACRGGSLPNCALWGNAALPRCPDDGGDWYHDDNTGWHPFNPVDTDVLLATVDFDQDTITSTAGQNSVVHNVRLGYASGDLEFQADYWAGSSNQGEFGVTGSQFTPNNEASPVSYTVFVRDSTMVQGATTWDSHH